MAVKNLGSTGSSPAIQASACTKEQTNIQSSNVVDYIDGSVITVKTADDTDTVCKVVFLLATKDLTSFIATLKGSIFRGNNDFLSYYPELHSLIKSIQWIRFLFPRENREDVARDLIQTAYDMREEGHKLWWIWFCIIENLACMVFKLVKKSRR